MLPLGVKRYDGGQQNQKVQGAEGAKEKKEKQEKSEKPVKPVFLNQKPLYFTVFGASWELKN